MNVLCLVFDRLHVGHLGVYGNSWIETPALDRLALDCCVFDQALVDTPQLDRLYRSYWQGLHGLYSRPLPPERRSLPAMLRAAGVATALLTDEPAVAHHPLAGDFDETIAPDPAWQHAVSDTIERTHLARSFEQMIEVLGEARRPSLLWCHWAALGTVWDAPLDLRRAYQEHGDPEPYAGSEVPDHLLAKDFDPDELIALTHAYAGQISLWDTCLGALVEFLDSTPAGRDTLLVLTSPRGLALGEHRAVGSSGDALYSEVVHVPLLVRLPGGSGDAVRSPALVEPADLWATLGEAFGLELPPSPTGSSLLPLVREDARHVRDRVCMVNGREVAIRTPAWHLRDAGTPELYAKPDDRFEVNDVAVRCQDEVETLRAAITEYDQAIQFGRAADLPPLAPVLVEGLE